MLSGRESLIRLVGKRRRTLLSNHILLAPPCNDSTTHVESSLLVLEENNAGPSAHGADLCRNKHAGKNSEEHDIVDWVTCPVCGRSVRGTDYMVNAHLDECLARGNKRKLTQRTLLQLNFSKRPDNIKTSLDESKIDENPKVSHFQPDFTLDNSGKDEYPSCCKIFLENPIEQHSINIEKKPEVAVDIAGVDMHLATLETFIVGRKFCDEVELKQGAHVYTLRDPENVKDPNAIKVLCVDSGQMLGFLPRELAKYLSPLIDKYCLKFEGSVTSLPRHSLDAISICLACQEMLPCCENDPEDHQLIQSLWGNVARAVEYAKTFPPNTKKYQQNFRILMQEVLKQSTHLFTDDEKLFLGLFESFSDDCQRLFLRLYTRKGPWFRMSAVSYSDILDCQRAAEELSGAGYFCSWESSNKHSKDDVKELLNVLTVPELRGISSLALLKKTIRGTRRQELIEWLITEYAHGTILSLPSLIFKQVGTCVRISSLAEFLLWRIQRLFFLNGEQDLSAFLLTDLGLVKYPDYKCNITRQIFQSRNDLLAYEEAIEVAQIMDQALDENNMEMVMKCIEISDGCISNPPNNLTGSSISETAGTFLSHFSASWVYSKVLTLGISVLERERRYKDAISLLKKLLCRITCDGRRGYWTLRLSMDLEHTGRIDESLSVAEEGVLDPWVRAGSKIALQRRVLRLGKPPRRWKIPCFSSTIKRKIREVNVRGTPLNSEPGTKNRYYGGDGEQCSVEQLALQYYAGDEVGGWRGVHTESGIWMTIFGLLMWDVIFADVPNVFRTRFQTGPLDLGTDSFYLSRKSLIEAHLSRIHKGMAESMLVASWEAYTGTSCQGVNWDRHSLPDLRDAVSCIGGPCLAALCQLLAQDYRSWSSGMPDLLLWRFSDSGGEAKLVEVKGPRDRLSEQQRAWLLVLMDSGFDAEVCKVNPMLAHV